jgi:hypothetical protein
VSPLFVRRPFECSNTEKDVVDNIKTDLREECYENVNSELGPVTGFSISGFESSGCIVTATDASLFVPNDIIFI